MKTTNAQVQIKYQGVIRKMGYTKRVMHWCLRQYEDLNALGPSAAALGI